MKGFKNVKAYVYGKGIINTNIGFENGKIAYIGDDQEKITEALPFENGQVIVPGFIDEHIHGSGGADVMDASIEALSAIANTLAKEGTTAFLATTLTQSPENISKALYAIKDYMELNPTNGAKIIGVHLEGPFLGLKHIGAQPKEHVAKPTIEAFEDYNKKCGNVVKLVSIAPEEDGAFELIRHLASKGVVASAAHTDAGYDLMLKAVKEGLSNVTHTYNGQKGIHHREVGTAGSAMLIDSLNCEAICDLIHLCAPAIKLLIKNKPHDKITLITDSMRAKHLEDGISEIGGQKVIVKNGEARLEDGTLAGSTLKMNDAIKNLVLSCDVPFTSAVDFATINPAKNLKVDSEMGTIEQGKLANLVVLTEEFEVAMTIREGNIIYKA